MTLRDWRAGELTMLLLALTLAVAALSSVGFLADRMQRGLDRDARQIIGADLLVRADHPIPPEFAATAQADGLRTATTAIFPSMVSGMRSDAPARLAAVKAVSDGYPLRGSVALVAGPRQPDRPANGIPAPGTVWVDPQLLDALKAKVGDTVKLGNRQFIIAAVIARELDRGFSFVNFSPRVMLRADELPSTGLIGYGSRVTYRLQTAGTDAAVARYQAWAQAKIDGGPGGNKLRGTALETLQEGQPQVRETLDRAHHFLTLVAMLTALLAAVAIAMSSHRYARRHIDGCAVMRCLGVSQRSLRLLFLFEFLIIGVLGSALGMVLGFAGHAVLLAWLGSLVDVALPAPSLWPVVQGIASGLVLLLGFALPPLLPLTQVPPVNVLRRELGGATRGAWWAYAVGILLFAALLIAAAGEWRLGGIVAGGFAGGIVIFGGVAWLALRGLAALARRRGASAAGFGWRYALASLERRGGGSALQVTALGIGLMCLLLLAMTRNDLVAGWRQSTPPDAANHFIIDIQPEQAAPTQQLLQDAGIPDVELAPMIRGRLTAINGKPIDAAAFDQGAQRLVEREFNLSYTATLPADNRIVAGDWYGATTRPEISIEEGIAKSLKVKLGDVLRFDVTGQTIDAPITSIRKLDWGSFRVNFFVVMPPAALRDFPTTFITSFHLPPGRDGALDRLVRQFPNETVVDIQAILAQMQRVLDQVINAVQFLFLFTLAAGLLVLYSALAGTRDERAKESALLRALGASHRQVLAVQLTEFAVVGSLAGALAACGAQAIGIALATHVFAFHLALNPWLLPAGIGAGVACAGLGGWWGLRGVLRRPPLLSLRDNV